MLLMIDIGNTRTKWGMAPLGFSGFVRTGVVNNGTDITVSITNQNFDLATVTDVVISCVGKEDYYQAITKWLAAQGEIRIHRFITEAVTLGVNNGYEEPKQLGADRWAALIAAKDLVEGDVIVVDCGSAVTIDLLAADGRHSGGLILPGLHMMRQSLHKGTAVLPEVGDATTKLADNTHDAIGGGTLFALVAAIETICTHHPQALCLITGGDAEQVLNNLLVSAQHQPDLVLKGLLLFANQLLR